MLVTFVAAKIKNPARAMNAELDLILNQLSIYNRDFHERKGIVETFHQAGLGEPDNYLKSLSEQGYISQVPGKPDTYTLSEKGKKLRYSGGFSHKAEHIREHRVAAILTFIAVALMVLFYLVWTSRYLQK
jgi:hypothetical protein